MNTQSAPTVAQPGQPTEYVILESEDGNNWEVSGSAAGRDNKEAIKAHLNGLGAVDASFVAVPARSWKPQRVRTRVALDFGEAT